jgi:replicative DNA helicase
MTSAFDHSRTVLAAIIPDRHDLLDLAVRDLTPQHIPDRILANLFTLLMRYSEKTSAVLTRAALAELLAATRSDAGTIAAYQESYDELAQIPADEPSFRWSLLQLRELAAERATREALNEAMEILTQGVNGDKDEVLRGHADARTHVQTRFADIDRDLSMQGAPEGDVRGEGPQILADYRKQKEARAAGRGRGIEFGVPALDDRVGGLHNGELILLVGYTSDGKTSLCVQLAWSAAVEQRKNVLFLTTETIRDQVRRRLIARHSCLPVFGTAEGLNSGDIKDGTLSDQDEKVFEAVVRDFDHNPGYGRFYLAQVPSGSGMAYIESKSLRVQRTMPVDLIVMDYLALLQPERRREQTREELSGILKAAKRFSTTFNDGKGAPFVSPWQVSRAARVEAEKTGHYTLNATSETAETSNSADTIISLLAPLDNESRRCKVKGQVMKHRDGEKANSIEMLVDFATSRFTGAHQQAVTIDTMFDPIGAFV